MVDSEARKGYKVDEQVPYSWIGQRVEVGILEAERHDSYNVPHALTEHYRIGTLETVNDLGIVASLEYGSEDEEEPTSTFYPWGAVLWLRLPLEE